jgi:uncharacterized membrane protein YobD (UPF0266 family)
VITERDETGRRRLEELLSLLTPTNSFIYTLNVLRSVCVSFNSCGVFLTTLLLAAVQALAMSVSYFKKPNIPE